MTASAEATLIPLGTARARLSLVWFVGAGVLFVALLGMSFGNVFAGQLDAVWSAAMPTVLPTLSLILSVLGSAAIVERGKQQKQAEDQPDDDQPDDDQPPAFVRLDFYRLTVGLSIAYLLLIFVSYFSHPFVTAVQGPLNTNQEEIVNGINTSMTGGQVTLPEGPSPADVIAISNLWLAPVQSLVVAAMGILFFTREGGRLPRRSAVP